MSGRKAVGVKGTHAGSVGVGVNIRGPALSGSPPTELPAPYFSREFPPPSEAFAFWGIHQENYLRLPAIDFRSAI